MLFFLFPSFFLLFPSTMFLLFNLSISFCIFCAVFCGIRKIINLWVRRAIFFQTCSFSGITIRLYTRFRAALFFTLTLLAFLLTFVFLMFLVFLFWGLAPIFNNHGFIWNSSIRWLILRASFHSTLHVKNWFSCFPILILVTISFVFAL